MAGRYQKQTVDYFPHYVAHGRVLYIMETTWGNEGYAAFYKLLEVLGKSEGHYFDARTCEAKEFLAASMGVSPEVCELMIEKLVKVGVLDRVLWEKARVIWMQSFVDSLDAAYRKRVIPVPEIPDINLFLPPEIGQTPPSEPISGAGNRQSKVKQSKVNKKRLLCIDSDARLSAFLLFWSAYPKKKSKQDAIKAFMKINPDDELLHTMLDRIEEQKKSNDWIREEGRFIPLPATWLNGRRWEDEGVDKHPLAGAVSDKTIKNIEVLKRWNDGYEG